jgi:hypothetical protein
LCATPKIYHSYHLKRRDQSLHSLQIDWILHLTPNRRGWHRTSDVHVVSFTFQALNLDNIVLRMADEHVIAEDVATAFNTCGRTQVRRRIGFLPQSMATWGACNSSVERSTMRKIW